MQEPRLIHDAIVLAGKLAVATLHYGDRHDARMLTHRMQELGNGTEPRSPAALSFTELPSMAR